MNTPVRRIRLTDQQVSALDALAQKLKVSGQRGATLNPLIAWLADTAAGALNETAAALNIASGCASGNDWNLLVEVIRPENETE